MTTNLRAFTYVVSLSTLQLHQEVRDSNFYYKTVFTFLLSFGYI
jgi:hypothetical protein